MLDCHTKLSTGGSIKVDWFFVRPQFEIETPGVNRLENKRAPPKCNQNMNPSILKCWQVSQ